MAFTFRRTIFFFIYLLASHTCTTSVLRHNEEECLALFKFKQSVSHQPYASTVDVSGFQKLDSWRKIANNESDHGSDCCLWDGVVCSNNGHVIELDLSQSSLHGSIKSNNSLFNLVHLQMLNLSMNDFAESKIPSEIARLKQLRSLYLSNSSFSGQIPIEISHLLRLTVLDLSWNPLKLLSPSLDYLLQNLTRLEELHLSGVEINSSIPPFLSNFSSLRSIDLQGCGLRNEFPSNIFHLPKLKFLHLAYNPNLSGSLPEFRNNTSLEHLFLFYTSFAGHIPESISNLKYLVTLSLFPSSYFSGCIPRSLSNMTHLSGLGLGQDDDDPSNQPGLEVCEKGWIGKLINLERLILVRINMHNEILPSLTNLTKLRMVRMRDNSISGHIPSSFMNFTQLTVIDLERNHLQGQISSSFSNFKRLEYLRLGWNEFSGRLDIGIFSGLPKLKLLTLDYNNMSCVSNDNHTRAARLPELEVLALSSCNLKEFPSFLRLQKKLSYLYLADNKIEGLIPEWILNNTQETLRVLELSNNSITGFYQHPHFLPWVRLEFFDIGFNKLQGQLPIPPLTMIIYVFSNNNLIGEIPPLICDVKSLRALALSYNNITGTLPPCFGNLSDSLSYLDLKGNKFHGPMMNAFTNESALEYIDLSENQFTGQVAKTLAKCTNLEFLIVARNSFNDSFPYWLGALPKLQVLILRSNNLHGAILDPTTMGSQFPKLQIIDLSNNGFSGQLHDRFFQMFNSMKFASDVKADKQLAIGLDVVVTPMYALTLTNKGAKREYRDHILYIFIAIDLSCNNFEGQIPQSVADLHGLESLNLSNNHFTGHILQSLGYLKNLESLDLSRNELSGEIPQELAELGFLEIFNVSFNQLHGTIPQGKQFNTFDETSYFGNPDLCGEVLYKKCHGSKATTLPSTSKESETLLPNDRIDWIIISLGVVSGLVFGVFIGNFLYARYDYWFNEQFKLRKDRWVRPLRNRSRK